MLPRVRYQLNLALDDLRANVQRLAHGARCTTHTRLHDWNGVQEHWRVPSNGRTKMSHKNLRNQLLPCVESPLPCLEEGRLGGVHARRPRGDEPVHDGDLACLRGGLPAGPLSLGPKSASARCGEG